MPTTTSTTTTQWSKLTTKAVRHLATRTPPTVPPDKVSSELQYTWDPGTNRIRKYNNTGTLKARVLATNIEASKDLYLIQHEIELKVPRHYVHELLDFTINFAVKSVKFTDVSVMKSLLGGNPISHRLESDSLVTSVTAGSRMVLVKEIVVFVLELYARKQALRNPWEVLVETASLVMQKVPVPIVEHVLRGHDEFLKDPA